MPADTAALSAEGPGIDAPLVRRLLAAQVPQWADLPLAPVASGGTDNAIFRLGDGMAVRLPRLADAALQVEKEQRWLPRLGPLLPLAVPAPLARGAPGEGYPWPWSVYRWLPGGTAALDRLADPRQAAGDLGRFVAALQRIDPAGGPPAGRHNGFRGEPLSRRDAAVRDAIRSLAGVLDADALTAAWDAALRAPEWRGPGVWLHGDLHAANLLADRGRLHAVIDFGLLGLGDPACDLMVGWTFLTAATRGAFRAELAVDDATWARGRGWALSFGLVAFACYRETDSVLAAISRHAIDEALADHRRGA